MNDLIQTIDSLWDCLHGGRCKVCKNYESRQCEATTTCRALLNDCLFILQNTAVKESQKIVKPKVFIDGMVERYECECGSHLLNATFGRWEYCPKCGRKIDWEDK